MLFQKTHAYHKMKDDVPEEVKQRRLREIIQLSRVGMAEMNAKQVGSHQLVLIEGVRFICNLHGSMWTFWLNG